jgi:hypothetical protein
VVVDSDVGAGDLRLLEAAARAWDRAEACRAVIDKEGAAVRNRFGELRANPLLAEERSQRDLFRRLMVALGLEGGAVPDPRGGRRR